MPRESLTVEPGIDEWTLPQWEEFEITDINSPYIVVLYNDDHHDMEEVVSQVQKATGYDIERCVRIMFEAHAAGRAIAYSGSEDECERCARILRQIRLQVETDRA